MANKLITVHYTSNGLPQIGLTPTIDIYQLNPNIPLSNILVVSNGSTVEIGMGWYRFDFLAYDPTKNYVFTFDGGPTLSDCERYKYGGNESYVEEISSGVWDETITDHTQVGSTGLTLNQIKADTASILISEATMTALLNLLLKYERNRTKIDVANAQLIVYDDNCTDILQVFNLLDFNGMPSVETVCQRVPVGC